MLVGVVNLLNEGNLAGAEQEVRQLIADANPNVPIDALILLAEIHRQKGEFVQAVEVIHYKSVRPELVEGLCGSTGSPRTGNFLMADSIIAGRMRKH